MRSTYQLIDKTGALISPTELYYFDLDSPTSDASLLQNQISLVFYNDIETNGDVITPIDPVTTGITGTVTPKIYPAKDARALPIIDVNGDPVAFDISSQNMLNVNGVIAALELTCTGVDGCEYILVKIDRGY
jgi:hypothetical protein